jgi:hypothetical protein
MNAPVTTPLSDIIDFMEICDQQAWFYDEGWIDLHTAVDNLQSLAGLWGLVDIYGQDAIQALIAYNAPPVEELPLDYAAQIVRQWEMADSRDSWKYTGEPPPSETIRSSDIWTPNAAGKQPYSPAGSTIKAFQYLVRHGDLERLKVWLADRPKDAPVLVALLESPTSC